MANHPSALKRVRQTRHRTKRNRANTARLRTALRQARKALRAGDATSARELLPATIEQIDKAAQKGVLHRNAAARHKSRLSKAVAKAAQK
ncbi:MAG: 30S ribosomal protein S20 [Terriglobales bacterium]